MSESVKTHTGVSVPPLFLRLLLIVYFQDAKTTAGRDTNSSFFPIATKVTVVSTYPLVIDYKLLIKSNIISDIKTAALQP